MQALSKQQKQVIIGSLASAAVGWGLFFVLRRLLPGPASPAEALAWVLLPPALLLFLLVAAVGNGRFLSEGIDPIQGKDPRFVTVSSNVLDNTVEQSLIFVLAGVSLICTHPLDAPLDTSGALPALALLFVLARVAFWLGYLKDSMLRAPGMALTLQINVVLLVWCVRDLLG